MKMCENLLNDQELSCRVFDVAQLQYIEYDHVIDTRSTTVKAKESKSKVTAWHNNGQNLLNHLTQRQIGRFSSNLFHALITWHRMYYKRSQLDIKVRGQRENVVCLIAKLLLPFWKSRSLNLMAMSKVWSEAHSLCAWAVHIWLTAAQIDRRTVGRLSNCNAFAIATLSSYLSHSYSI